MLLWSKPEESGRHCARLIGLRTDFSTASHAAGSQGSAEMAARLRPAQVLAILRSSAKGEGVREAFSQCAVPHLLTVIVDGEVNRSEVVDLLEHGLARLPDLLVLEAGSDDQLTVQDLKQNRKTRRVPIVAITDTVDNATALYEQHVNCCIVDDSELQEHLCAAANFWLTAASLADSQASGR